MADTEHTSELTSTSNEQLVLTGIYERHLLPATAVPDLDEGQAEEQAYPLM